MSLGKVTSYWLMSGFVSLKALALGAEQFTLKNENVKIE